MTPSLYNDHFGFTERPFTLSPDPEFLFWSKAHKRAFTVLEYGLVTQALMIVVTGEVGTGKTTLIQALLRKAEDHLTIGLISNAQGDRGDLLRWVLNALDVSVPAEANYVALFQTFQQFLLSEYAAGRHVVLIVDEAQNLDRETLEELRMLTNINSGKDELLQIILVGQPELRDILRQPELRQFAQRVVATCHIDAMDLTTTRDYIAHRLLYAGGTGKEITPEAVQYIYEETEGIPRMINKLCDLALVYASSAGHDEVGISTVREIIDDGLLLKPTSEALFPTDSTDTFEKAAE